MSTLMTEFKYPTMLYHGTVFYNRDLDANIEKFKSRMLDRSFWKNSKDFGAGFYTTINKDQAKKWALKKWRENPPHEQKIMIPCVLAIEWSPYLTVADYYGVIDQKVFPGSSLTWADYILDHRLNGNCSCKKHHTPIIIGPAADNSGNHIGILLNQCRKNGKDAKFFLDGIRSSPDGINLTDGELNDQIVFCDETANPVVTLKGYYKTSSILGAGGWNYVQI